MESLLTYYKTSISSWISGMLDDHEEALSELEKEASVSHDAFSASRTGGALLISPTSTLSSMSLSIAVSAKEGGAKMKNTDYQHEPLPTTSEQVTTTSCSPTPASKDTGGATFTFMTPMTTISCDMSIENKVSSLEEVHEIPSFGFNATDESFYTVDTLLTKESFHTVKSYLSNKRGSRNECLSNKRGSRNEGESQPLSQSPLSMNNQVQPSQCNKRRQQPKKVATYKTKKIKKIPTPQGLKPRHVSEIRHRLGLPQGLKPRMTISELRMKLGVAEPMMKKKNMTHAHRDQKVQDEEHYHYPYASFETPTLSRFKMLHDNNDHYQEQEQENPIPTHLGRTAKKSNVSFASSLSLTTGQGGAAHAFSPTQTPLKIDEVKTAVGLVVAYNASLNKSGMMNASLVDNSSINMDNENDKCFTSSPNQERFLNINGVSFVPTTGGKSRRKIRSCSGSSITNSQEQKKGGVVGAPCEYEKLESSQSQENNHYSSYACSSEDDQSDLTPSMVEDWYQYELYKEEQEEEENEHHIDQEDWDTYEKYKEEEEDRERSSYFLDNSRETYSSNHYLFETKTDQIIDHMCYDFSPVTDDFQSDTTKEETGKPFVVKKGEVSFVSDISRTKSEDNILNNMVSTKQNLSALSGPSIHRKGVINSSCDVSMENNNDNFEANAKVKTDLETKQQMDILEMKSSHKKYEKERMIIHAVRCLKDNLQFVLDVEETFVTGNSSRDPLTGTCVEKEGILRGYKSGNQKELLSNLFSALTLINNQRNILKGSTDVYLHDSIHFFGSLVTSAPDFENHHCHKWIPKTSLRNAIQSELSTPIQNEDLNTTINSKAQCNLSTSFGATTMSSHDNVFASGLTSGISTISVCQTIVIITTLLQKISTELELLHGDPNAIAGSEYLCRLYLQLMSIPRGNLHAIVNGFTISCTSIPNVKDDTFITHATQGNESNDHMKEFDIIKNTLMWDLNFMGGGKIRRKRSSSLPLLSRHYHHARLHENKVLSSSEFPTTIDVPTVKF